MRWASNIALAVYLVASAGIVILLTMTALDLMTRM